MRRIATTCHYRDGARARKRNPFDHRALCRVALATPSPTRRRPFVRQACRTRPHRIAPLEVRWTKVSLCEAVGSLVVVRFTRGISERVLERGQRTATLTDRSVPHQRHQHARGGGRGREHDGDCEHAGNPAAEAMEGSTWRPGDSIRRARGARGNRRTGAPWTAERMSRATGGISSLTPVLDVGPRHPSTGHRRQSSS